MKTRRFEKGTINNENKEEKEETKKKNMKEHERHRREKMQHFLTIGFQLQCNLL